MAGETRTFLDTNVLVYLFDTAEEAKRERAGALLRELSPSSIVVSAQVLGEFYWVTTRKLAAPLRTDQARSAVDRLCRFAVVGVDHELVRGAIELSRTASLQYWDALIVRAARSGACGRLLSEDLAHGQVIDDIRVENPFLDLDVSP